MEKETQVINVLKAYKNGDAYSKMELEFGVKKQTICNWVKRANKEGANLQKRNPKTKIDFKKIISQLK